MKTALIVLALLALLLPAQAEKLKTITINGTTFLADPALLSEKPKPTPQKKSPPKSQPAPKPTAKPTAQTPPQKSPPKNPPPKSKSRPIESTKPSKPEADPPPDWPPLHTSGSVHHPDYDPTVTTQECPSTFADFSKAYQRSQRIVGELVMHHPNWAVYSFLNHSISTGLRRMPDGTPLSVSELRAPPKGQPRLHDTSLYIPYGEIHILAIDHPTFGPVGTVLLDTLPDSPHLQTPTRLPDRAHIATPEKPFTPSNRSWGPEQATGEPDTPTAGDIPTAWASIKPDAGPEWLEVAFPNPVEIAEIRIRETFNPGAISKVTAPADSESEHILWEGTATPSPAPSEMSITPQEKIISNKLKIHLDTRRVPGWNEIDAVELIATDGTRQWATQATASSTYADFPLLPQSLPTGTENIPSDNDAYEQEVLTLVNAERQKRKLPALVWNENLARAARYHAADMAFNVYFAHDSMARSKTSPRSEPRKIGTANERVKNFYHNYFGENIAVGQPDPATVMKCWMSSPGHRANILRREARTLGIGYIANHWVQNFGR